MGSGCFKPPTPTTQLNLSAIDQIFEQAKQSTPPSSNSEQKCLAYYLQMKEIISKKGQLKKLCDYMSSHRECLCQTLLHSYRILGQSKGLSFKYVSVIILDAILNIAPKPKSSTNTVNYSNNSNATNNNESKPMNINQYTINRISDRSLKMDSQHSRHIFSNSQKQRQQPPSFILSQRPLNQIQNQPHPNININTNINTNMNMNIKTILDQFKTLKFQSIYFNIINVLIQEDGILYKLALDCIIKYCQITSRGGMKGDDDCYFEGNFNQGENGSRRENDRFGAEGQIGQIMKNINYHLIVGNQMEISLKAYWAMLTRLKDNFFTSNVDSLASFFDIWMSYNVDIYNNSFEKQEVEQNPLSHKLQVVPTARSSQVAPTQNEIARMCSCILSLFLKTCIENYQHNTILEEIFKVFDKYKFKNIMKIENLIFDCIDRSQLKAQFSRALFMNLLAYVGWPEAVTTTQSLFLRQQSKISQSRNQPQQSSYTPLQKQWLQCYKLPPSFPTTYKNILSPQSKLNSLHHISKWLFEHKIVDLSQLLMYSSSNLIQCFIFNLYSEEDMIKDKVVNQMRGLMERLRRCGLGVVVGNAVMREVQENGVIDDQARWTLMTIWQHTLQKQKKLDITQQHSYLLQSLNISYCFENNLKIINITSKTLYKLNKISLTRQFQQICCFLDSVYKELFVGFTSILHKIILIQEFGKAFCCGGGSRGSGGGNVREGFLEGFFVGFLERVNQVGILSDNRHSSKDISKIERKQSIIPQNHLLFLDYLTLILCQILNLGIQSQNISNYCLSIKQSPQNQHIQILNNYQTDRISLSYSLSFSYTENQLSNMQFYKESSQYFKNKQGNQNDSIGGPSVLWRGQQSYYSKESMRDMDKDLEDILNIVKN